MPLLSLVVVLPLVAGIALLIIVYAAWYLHHDDPAGKFIAMLACTHQGHHAGRPAAKVWVPPS